MQRATIGCGEYKRQRVAAAEEERPICHGCGRRPDCQGCMEYFSFIDGVEDKNYNKQYTELMSKAHCVQQMTTQVHKDVEKELREYDPNDPIKVVQLANTLFEAAVVITAMAQQNKQVSSEDRNKIKALNQHGWDGMAMINGYQDDDESFTPISRLSDNEDPTSP